MSVASDRYGDKLASARERLLNSTISDPALSVCIAGLARVEELLRRPLRIVVMGEYNSGKTSVTDLLIGQGLLPSSVVANTGVPVLVTYAGEAALFGIDRNGARVRIDGGDDDPLTDLSYRAIQLTLPLPWLERHQVLDTPATAAPAVFVAEADIVLWCTVATRAWTESERTAWNSLPRRCFRSAILVATHKDSIYSDEECDQVVQRLRSLTQGAFRDVLLLSAAQTPGSPEAGDDPGDTAEDAALLRDAVAASADAIMNRRLQKAGRIVRRLSRLAFHEFGRDAVRPEAAALLSRWDSYVQGVLEDLKAGRQAAPATIEALLYAYAACAEALRSGVVNGNGANVGPSQAVTAPLKWPDNAAASVQFARDLASDLTALLRLLAGSSRYEAPDVRRERQAIRATLLALADLDGAFDALGRMLGSSRKPEAAAS